MMDEKILEAHLLFDIPSWALARGWIETTKDGSVRVSRKGKEWIAKQISSARMALRDRGEDSSGVAGLRNRESL